MLRAMSTRLELSRALEVPFVRKDRKVVIALVILSSSSAGSIPSVGTLLVGELAIV
jgi:hypothetical protein